MANPRLNNIGEPNNIMPKGNLMYGDDGASTHPMLCDTAGASTSGIGVKASRQVMAQREYFIFYPGASALSSTSTITGMVISGVRQGSNTITTALAASTYWMTNVTYSPLRSGKIDGLSTGGVITGQITVGLIGASASTADAKVTARIKNNAGTTYTTCLFLSATVIAVGGTTEVFKTYDINHLLTDANFNSVPLDFAVGVQSDKAAATCAVIARIMDSSYIEGYFEPKT